MEVVELTLDTALDLESYTFRNEDGKLMTLTELIAESDGEPVIDEVTEESIDETSPTKADNPKIRFNIDFPYELVRSTSKEDFESWLNDKMDEMMLSMLDQFKKAKDNV
jgi:hypothetical protein